MIRKIAIAIAIVLVVVGALAGVKTLEIRKLIAGGKAYKQPPETVSTAVARACALLRATAVSRSVDCAAA